MARRRRRKAAPRRRRSYARRRRNVRRGGKTLSVTLLAILIEVATLVGVGGSRLAGLKNGLDNAGNKSFIPGTTFLAVMGIINLAVMWKPELGRKINGRLKAFGLRI